MELELTSETRYKVWLERRHITEFPVRCALSAEVQLFMIEALEMLRSTIPSMPGMLNRRLRSCSRW
jgi:hypothetical protein